MIRVLNIVSDTNIGGAGRVLLNYLQYADRARFHTMVAVPRGSLLKQPLEEVGAEVFEVDGIADRSYDKNDVKLLKELIGRVEPDIVHTHGALSGRIAGRQCGKTVIYTRHSAFPVSAKVKYPPGRWVNKLLNEYYSDHIIAVSPAAAENLTDGGISPKRITTMMNGVAPVERCSEEACAALREQWGVGEDEFVLGILARLGVDVDGNTAIAHITAIGGVAAIAGGSRHHAGVRRQDVKLILIAHLSGMGQICHCPGHIGPAAVKLDGSTVHDVVGLPHHPAGRRLD